MQGSDGCVGPHRLGEHKCASVVSSRIGVLWRPLDGASDRPAMHALVVLRGVSSDGVSNGGVSDPLMVADKRHGFE